jgi:hypothetical protein
MFPSNALIIFSFFTLDIDVDWPEDDFTDQNEEREYL